MRARGWRPSRWRDRADETRRRTPTISGLRLPAQTHQACDYAQGRSGSQTPWFMKTMPGDPSVLQPGVCVCVCARARARVRACVRACVFVCLWQSRSLSMTLAVFIREAKPARRSCAVAEHPASTPARRSAPAQMRLSM